MATTYRPSPEAQTAIEHLTARTGLSAQKLLDQAVVRMDQEDTLERDVMTAFAHAQERWADVLERLRVA